MIKNLIAEDEVKDEHEADNGTNQGECKHTKSTKK